MAQPPNELPRQTIKAIHCINQVFEQEVSQGLIGVLIGRVPKHPIPFKGDGQNIAKQWAIVLRTVASLLDPPES